jgi:hypothetical protein
MTEQAIAKVRTVGSWACECLAVFVVGFLLALVAISAMIPNLIVWPWN